MCRLGRHRPLPLVWRPRIARLSFARYRRPAIGARAALTVGRRVNSLRSTRDAMTGEAFGNFQIVATLGKGGMGEVLLAQHQRIARRAAIKVLSPELTKDPD